MLQFYFCLINHFFRSNLFNCKFIIKNTHILTYINITNSELKIILYSLITNFIAQFWEILYIIVFLVHTSREYQENITILHFY